MPNYSREIFFFLLTILILTAIFFSGSAQASFLDVIRAWVTINPLFVDVSAPTQVKIDRTFHVTAKVLNKGEEKIENAKAEIFLPSELVLLREKPVQEIGVIPGKKEKKIRWSAKGEKVGNYFISVKVSGELRGELISAEDTARVSVVTETSPGRFDFLREFFERWFNFKYL